MNTPPFSPPPPIRPNIRSDFLLDPNLAFLNHGSFGSVPRVVLDEQTMWRDRIESDPIEILGRHGSRLIDDAKRQIGQTLGMKPSDFGMVTNATEGINCVLRSLEFSPGDELLTTNHVYNAVRQAMRYIAQKTGATYKEIEIPVPINSAADIEQAILRAITPKTKLLVIDHITSPTALVFPIPSILAACADRGVDVLVDGAHAPGTLPLNVQALAPAYYAANLHKWTCAPKGSAFLWVRPDKQSRIHPWSSATSSNKASPKNSAGKAPATFPRGCPSRAPSNTCPKSAGPPSWPTTTRWPSGPTNSSACAGTSTPSAPSTAHCSDQWPPSPSPRRSTIFQTKTS
jgi:isopenicillin-N epimerase